MDLRTGEIYKYNKYDANDKFEYYGAKNASNCETVEFNSDQITDRQRTNMQVSKYDTKSYLGHIFTEHRKGVNDMKIKSPSDILKLKAKRKAAKQARKKNRK